MGTQLIFWFWPPVAFIVMLFAVLGFSWLCARFSLRPGQHAKDQRQPYACGERDYNHSARPDYSAFFPFAFFFTIAHVAALTMTAIPASPRALAPAALYMAGIVSGLCILMRKD